MWVEHGVAYPFHEHEMFLWVGWRISPQALGHGQPATPPNPVMLIDEAALGMDPHAWHPRPWDPRPGR